MAYSCAWRDSCKQFICVTWLMHTKMIGLFCKRVLSIRQYSAKKTHNLKEPICMTWLMHTVYMRDMAHAYNTHGYLFIGLFWSIQSLLIYLLVSLDFFIRLFWCIQFICMTWLMHETHIDICDDSFICVTHLMLMHTRDMAHVYMEFTRTACKSLLIYVYRLVSCACPRESLISLFWYTYTDL